MNEPLAFSAEHVCRLTSLSMRQLAYWDQTDFFRPRYASESRRVPYSRIYSFQDVVGLKTIALLRNTHHIPLQELRLVAAWLTAQGRETWSSLTFYVSGRHVYFEDPRTQARLAARPQTQTVLPIKMKKIVHEALRDTARLRERPEGDLGRIEQHRYIVHNAPVLAGTRIPTSAVWNFHQAGYASEAIIREYPRLTAEDVRSAITFEAARRQKRAG